MSTSDVRPFRFAGLAALLAASFAMGCSASTDAGEQLGDSEESIVDVPHTAVERQSIGNCWIYAHATWAESMHKSATGRDFDISQSYWTYWHWFGEIGSWTSEIQTGGWWSTANDIAQNYGIMDEKDFVLADTTNEMSARQASALAAMNTSLKTGALKTREARADRALVRRELDKAWGLTPETSAMLGRVFGAAGDRTFARGTATAAQSPVTAAANFPVKYATRARNGVVSEKTTTFATAMREWRDVGYTRGSRAFHQRVQRSLHARQPTIVVWDVDFNAMENGQNDRRGSFNMTTLAAAGAPGRQGGHMTVFEDYEVETRQFGTLKAGVTLDPVRDKAKLDAALLTTSKVKFYRVKNSWGAARPDRAFAPGFPGYHDLYMDYLDGPVTWCSESDETGTPAERGCNSTTTPLNSVILPPGF